QAALQRSLLAAASFSPSDIDFVETHGTGTSLGDLIEIEGINAVFRGSHTPERPLVLGAAKTCVGHTEVVAGLVGIVKAIKQLSTGKVTGLNSLSGGRLNRELDTTLIPLHIPSTLVELPKRNEANVPYRAIVVAYGFAGTLAGTILEAPEVSEPIEINAEPLWMIFAVSAKSPDALQSYLRLYLAFCETAPASHFRSICYTSCVGREMYRYRFSCVVKDLDGLVQYLKDRLSQ
ncbi:thiolase-like protein, partial [Mycena leptocephala]